ncbi:MAG TPA: hypothetical protein VG498_22965 [Terriglobales bacterium]|nr:hypothetical protein [Terriglobales bacterium]
MKSLGAISIAAIVLMVGELAHSQTKPAQKVNPDAALAAEFDKRVIDYMKLRQKAQSGLSAPKGTESSGRIAEYQRDLAERIRAARPDAKQGDIFTADVTNLFRRLIENSINGPDGSKIRTSYERAEPIRGVRLTVDQAYPDGLPLQSMPPSLLLNLPKLPKKLEFRFVDHELLLRDIAANLIVDLIPDLTTPAQK